jgi:glycosyltransferase involved in cell wall biosynthesis
VRLAIFSPMPPIRSGIADYTRDLIGALRGDLEIDLFVATGEEVDEARKAALPARCATAHDFPWRHHREPYDLTIFQMGNSWCHDFMWPYLFRYPGLVVLHDGHLHHARAWSLLRRRRSDDYRAELAFNHPELPPEAAEAALAGFGGTLYYFWPMLRSVVTSARAVVVHSAALAGAVGQRFPDAAVHVIRMGLPTVTPQPEAVRTVRERHGLTDASLVLAAFGGVTPEKRLRPLFDAVAVARRYHPDLRVLLVGPTHPHFDVTAEARSAGVDDLLTVTGFVEDSELPAYLAAADIVSCLRFPTSNETSASWLHALAAARPTIVTDLPQHAALPTLDPRSWTVAAASARGAVSPVAVSIDLLDEVHSLTLALKRLVTDAELRASLGASARQYWQANHTIDLMASDYRDVVARTAARPAPAVVLPAHLRPDGTEHLRDLLAPFASVAQPLERR